MIFKTNFFSIASLKIFSVFLYYILRKCLVSANRALCNSILARGAFL